MIPALYRARVMHLRRLPAPKRRVHQFRYTVFRLWLDLDRLDETAATLRTVSRNRLSLISFHDRDHGPRDGSDLRVWADGILAAQGIDRPARVMLYAFPRMLGYAFNPLSAYFAYDDADALVAVIYEVRNTDGDMTHYVFDLSGKAAPYRHASEKTFYVSPFIDAHQDYAFTLGEPGETLALRIRLDGAEGLTLLATENGAREALTDRAILSAMARVPLMSFKIIVGIYWEAVRLRLKGAEFFRHPGRNGRYVRKP